MAEFKLEKNGKQIFNYQSKKNKNYKGKKMYRYRYGLTKFEYKLLWTGLWLVFILCLCSMFETMGPLWLLIVWLFGIV